MPAPLFLSLVSTDGWRKGLTVTKRPNQIPSADHQRVAVSSQHKTHSYRAATKAPCRASDVRRDQSRKYLIDPHGVGLAGCHRMWVSGNDGQHMSIGLAAPICATCMGSAATTGCERGVIESGVDASLSKRLGRHRTDPRYLMPPLGMPPPHYQFEPNSGMLGSQSRGAGLIV
jgi:hypothetical protein